MSQNIYCPNCGAVNESSSRFCSSCGSDLIPTSTKQPQQPVSPGYQPPLTQPQPAYQQQSPSTTVVYTQQQRADDSNPMAVTSFITGLLGFIFSWIPIISYISPVLLLVAFITGIIGVMKPNKKGLAITGIILSVLDLVIFIVLVIFIAAIYSL